MNMFTSNKVEVYNSMKQMKTDMGTCFLCLLCVKCIKPAHVIPT